MILRDHSADTIRVYIEHPFNMRTQVIRTLAEEAGALLSVSDLLCFFPPQKYFFRKNYGQDRFICVMEC